MTRKVVLHSLFWLCMLVFAVYFKTQIYELSLGLCVTSLVDLSFLAAMSYINLYLIKSFYEKRQLLKYAVQAIVIILVISAVRYYADKILCVAFEIHYKDYGNRLVIAKILISSIFWGISSAYYFSIHYLKQKEATHQIEREKLQLEIAFQQSRVNPHFLFNTLGNIHALTIQKSDRAGDALLDLSDLMRYMLYDGKAEKVPIGKEVDFISNFIKLQKLRLSNGVTVQFDTAIEEHVMIEPLLFISFVENAFKHGYIADGAQFEIELLANSQRIEFVCINQKTEEIYVEGPSGFGIENIRKRLQLLYPVSHQLSIDDGAERFKVHLKIDLKP